MVKWRFRILGRKEKRFYTYSLTLSIEQINWLRSKADSPAFVRKLLDDAMIAESAEEIAKLKDEAAKLEERAQLLYYKGFYLAYHKEENESDEVHAATSAMPQVERNALYEKAAKIKKRVNELEEEKWKREQEQKESEAPNYG